MLILRKQPFPLEITLSDLTDGVGYLLSIMNEHAVDLYEESFMSMSGTATIPLPDYFSRYDAEYRLEVSEIESYPEPKILGDLVYVDTLTIARPYVDPALIAETEDEIAQVTTYESLARAIIDSVTGGFKYVRDVYETTGLGADYVSVPMRLNKIVRVYENDVRVYDSEETDPDWKNVKEYKISPDRTAITENVATSTGINRYQSKPFRGRVGSSDSFAEYNANDANNFTQAVYDTKTFVDMVGNSSMFPNGWDYTFVVETGWPIIPEDIKNATLMLMNDIKCGNNPYFNSYIKEYETDQFTLKFDAKAFQSTGNRVVDKILEAYPRSVYRLGVL